MGLVLSRREGSSVVLGNEWIITVSRVKGGQVRLLFNQIDTAKRKPIHRIEALEKENPKLFQLLKDFIELNGF